MVLRLNFSQVDVSHDINKLESNFNINTNSDLETFVTIYSQYFQGFNVDYDNSSSSNILKRICNYILAKKLPKLYIIIDEYDNFTNQLIVRHDDQLYQDTTKR